MSKLFPFVTTLGAGAALVLSACTMTACSKPADETAAAGDAQQQAPAPADDGENWSMTLADGSTFNLAEQRGRVVLVDFWATWCGPCKASMPAIQAMHEELADDGLVIVGASVWERGGDPVGYMKENGYTYKLAVNAEEVAEKYEVQAIPTFLVFNAKGELVERVLGGGPQQKAQLREAVTTALAEIG